MNHLLVFHPTVMFCTYFKANATDEQAHSKLARNGHIAMGGKSPIGILKKVGPFQEILKIVTNLFIFDRSCQKTITLLVSYKR